MYDAKVELDKFMITKEFFGLNEDQKSLFKFMKNGFNIFLTGPGGTGKSHTVRTLFNFVDKTKRIRLGKTASTGVAAININGVTIHSWAGIGLGEGSTQDLIKLSTQNKKAQKRIRNVEFLFVDEVSMLKADFLDKLDIVFKYHRMNNKPFGGVKMIFSGDFLQLPPVFKGGNEKEESFAFEARSWKEANIQTINLTKIVRQSNPEFSKLLNSIRLGEDVSLDLLKDRINFTFPSDNIVPVKLYCKNVDVDYVNTLKLKEIQSPTKTYYAQDDGNEKFKTFFDKNCPAPSILNLKEGAQVMLLKNLDFDLGLVNGAMGIVTKFLSDDVVVVKFAQGNEEMIEMYEWEIKEQIFKDDGKISYRKIASRKQIPLKLAWATTIHKSQGMTLDRAEIDISEAFAAGQAYVALSRVKDLNGLSLKPFDKSRIFVNNKCIGFYKNL